MLITRQMTLQMKPSFRRHHKKPNCRLELRFNAATRHREVCFHGRGRDIHGVLGAAVVCTRLLALRSA